MGYPDRGLPGERRVLDDRGRGKERLARSRSRDDGESDIDRKGGRGNNPDVLRETCGEVVVTQYPGLPFRAGAAASINW